MVLSSAMLELVVKTKKGEQISGYGEGFEQKEVKEKDVCEGIFPLDESKKKRNILLIF